MEEVENRSWNSLGAEGKEKRGGRGLWELTDTTGPSNQSLLSFVNNILDVFTCTTSVAREQTLYC